MPLIIQIIVVGFVVGFVARYLSPGPRKASGFILTTGIGIAGALLATLIGRAIGWLEQDQIAGFLGMLIGAVILTTIWNLLVAYRLVRDPTTPSDPGERRMS